MSYGHCPPDKLCDACLEDAVRTHEGTARRRGDTWRAQRAGAAPTTEADRELLEALAIRRVADITSDVRLRARLAGILLRWTFPELH
jgi:hypothetical protein